MKCFDRDQDITAVSIAVLESSWEIRLRCRICFSKIRHEFVITFENRYIYDALRHLRYQHLVHKSHIRGEVSVLNALRHLRYQHPPMTAVNNGFHKCSTPYGI